MTKEQLKECQKYIEQLAEYGIDLAESDGYIDNEKYDELPDEMEIEDITLSFPDDQDYYSISPENFLEYMREINSLKKESEIVRTDTIIQVAISSARMGYTGFEDRLTSYSFAGDGINVAIVKRPFLVGVINAKEGRYEEDFGLGATEPYTAIEIRTTEKKGLAFHRKLVEQICYFLTEKLGVAVYPWEGPDIDEIYDTMDEYYEGSEEEGVSTDEESEEVKIDSLPEYTPLLKMFRQAKGIEDPEIRFLQYYKMIEFVSPVAAKLVAYEHLNKRLDLLATVHRDYKYLDSIVSLVRKYDKDMRDDSLALAVIENCVDPVPLYEMIPQRMRKIVKAKLKLQKDALTDGDVSEEQLRGLQKQLAAILYATRNSIVHAKSNYEMTGNELLESEIEEANDMMTVIAHSIINWNQRQAEGFRV